MVTCCRERLDPGLLMQTKDITIMQTKYMAIVDPLTRCMVTLTRVMVTRVLRIISAETVVTLALAHRSLSREVSFHQYREETVAGN